MADADTQSTWKLSPRLVVEFGVIAVGVFVGLAADAAWQARTDRATEIGYLEALRVELIAATAELEEDHANRDRMAAAADSLAMHFAGGVSPDSVVVRWTQSLAFGLRKFAPPSAVLDELVSTGNLRLLRSSQLRFGLMEYQRERLRLAFLEDRVLAVTEEALLPRLGESVSWIPEIRQFPSVPSLPASAADAFSADPELQNAILLKANRLALLQRRSREMLTALAALQELVQAAGS